MTPSLPEHLDAAPNVAGLLTPASRNGDQSKIAQGPAAHQAMARGVATNSAFRVYLEFLPTLPSRLRRNLRLAKEIALYFKNDALSYLGVYRYPHRTVFIAGLPKSGTTWLATALQRLPGYNIRPIYDPKRITLRHDIGESVFSWLPRTGHSIIKLHTRFSADNLSVITRFVDRFVVTIRDLRDACVSAYHHVRNDRRHPDHALYHSLSPAEGLQHRLKVTLDAYVPWVRDWAELARKHPDTILLVRYEDLRSRPHEVFARVLRFYDIAFDQRLLDAMADSGLREERDLNEQLRASAGLGTASSARKGLIGEWRFCLGAVHNEMFQASEAAGLMRSLGYE